MSKVNYHTKLKRFPGVKIMYKNKLTSEGSELHGYYCYTKKCIFISKTAHKTQEELDSTIFHELLHLLLHKTGHHDLIGEEDKEEALVVMLENYLAESMQII